MPRVWIDTSSGLESTTTSTRAVSLPPNESDANYQYDEDDTLVTIWEHDGFETLRHDKHHFDFESSESLLPKAVLLNVDPTNDHPLFIANDGSTSCGDNNSPLLLHQPLIVHSYQRRGGSKNRRLNDFVRSQGIEVNSLYLQEDKDPSSDPSPSESPTNNENDDNSQQLSHDWIKGWLDSFVATHGGDKVYQVLEREGNNNKNIHYYSIRLLESELPHYQAKCYNYKFFNVHNNNNKNENNEESSSRTTTSFHDWFLSSAELALSRNTTEADFDGYQVRR